MDFKEILNTAIAVAVGVIVANIISAKFLKSTWESDYDEE